MLVECLEADLKKPLSQLLKDSLCVVPSDYAMQIWDLKEECSGTANNKFTIVSDQRYDTVVIKPTSSIMAYFNNAVGYLTCIPDFLIFINRKGDYLNTDVVVIDMKSTGADNRQLRSQFRNGKNIASYLASVTNKQINKCKFLKSSVVASVKKRDACSQKDKFNFGNGFYITKSRQLNILDIIRDRRE